MKNKEYLNLINNENCCGCGACYNKCPVGAISMEYDEEGFLTPFVDKSICIDCGLCKKSCPILNQTNNNTEPPLCYAVKAIDSIRLKSSSGGIFSLIANKVIELNGYVCGAAFDNNWAVRHILINNKSNLQKLRNSKYVQSNINECYSKINQLLKDNKPVLFSGTPCQVAGLYSYLGENPKNLLTTDILCHGAPSPGVWQKYLHEEFKNTNIISINFRDKEKIGWSCSKVTIKTDKDEFVTDKYTKGFHNSIINRKCCDECKFSTIPRIADITLGDFWGIGNYDKSLPDGKGISLVLINNQKGNDYFESIKNEFTACKLITLSQNYNNGNLNHLPQPNKRRDEFFKQYKQGKNISKCIKKITKSKQYSLFQEIFSIKNSNDKTHKVITLCGIKIKFRKRNK